MPRESKAHRCGGCPPVEHLQKEDPPVQAPAGTTVPLRSL